jgi:hypothetical protein
MKSLNTVYKKGLLSALDMVKDCSNNTPQAYPAVRCRDAQTGGLIFSALFSFTSIAFIGNKFSDTPAMPLNDAHFGGFFASEVQP